MFEELSLPFSKEQFIQAAAQLELPENVDQTRAKPRVSAISDCSRQIAYSMSNTPRSNPEVEDFGRNHQRLTNEMHRVDEDVSVAVVERLGLTVIDRQIELPEWYPLTGHPDGALVKTSNVYYNYNAAEDPRTYAIDRTLDDGLVWGFEHKVIGYLRFVEIFREGLFKAKPGYVTQSLLYGDALDWDAVLFVILADDAAATKGERTKALRQKTVPAWAKREDWNPKVQLHALDLRPLKALVPAIHNRAKALSEVAGRPEEVQREFNGTKTFPCGYCDWRDRCNIDGDGSIVIPKGAFV